MNGKYLVDTNYAIQLFTGLKTVEERLAQDPDLYLSAIVLGELFLAPIDLIMYNTIWNRSVN